MDKETLTRLLTLSAMYVGEDQPAVTENLHCSQATENTGLEEVMEVYSTHFRRLSPKPSKMSDFHLMGSQLSPYGVQLSPNA